MWCTSQLEMTVSHQPVFPLRPIRGRSLSCPRARPMCQPRLFVANTLRMLSAMTSPPKSNITGFKGTSLLCDIRVLDTGRRVPFIANSPAHEAAHTLRTGGRRRFRFPPEPNGMLHIGHAKSICLNFGTARDVGGECFLRFDDTNPEVEDASAVDSIVRSVEWLGYCPTKVTYTSDYFSELERLARVLLGTGRAYACFCSAQQIVAQRQQWQQLLRRWGSGRHGDNNDAVSEAVIKACWCDHRLHSTPEENLAVFDGMTKGKYEEGAVSIRLACGPGSIDELLPKHSSTSQTLGSSSDGVALQPGHQTLQANMLDPVAMRIKYLPHYRTKDERCVYPSYDFSHPVVDSLEDIDYSLCTLEFENRRELYYWLLHQLDMYKPRVWEFARLNLDGAVVSKRKVNHLIKSGAVTGYSDPRLATLDGLRRRGVTASAVRTFLARVGVTRSDGVSIQPEYLDSVVRDELNSSCLRRSAVLRPLLVLLLTAETSDSGTTAAVANDEEEKYRKLVDEVASSTKDAKNAALHEATVRNHPVDEQLGYRSVVLPRLIYIDSTDFRLAGAAPGDIPAEPDANGVMYGGSDKSYYGLSDIEGRCVGLKGFPGRAITVVSFYPGRGDCTNNNNKTHLLVCRLVDTEYGSKTATSPQQQGSDAGKVPMKKPKTAITWVSVTEAVPASFWCLSAAVPGSGEAAAPSHRRGFVERQVLRDLDHNKDGGDGVRRGGAGSYTVQFERVGYFTLDNVDKLTGATIAYTSKSDASPTLQFIETVSLRAAKGKPQKGNKKGKTPG